MKSDATTETKKGPSQSVGRLSLIALGVVFGDIATSPIYAIRECFHGAYGITADPANILGVLSLVFWALTLIVTLKYVTFVLRADNQGEGGVMALTAMISKVKGVRGQKIWGLVGGGMFGACLLYGDGMITPAISVLSAVEGIGIITPFFKPYIVPLSVAILAVLFFLQHRGTAWIGGIFGPVILLWLLVIATLGIVQIIHTPQVITAVFPQYAMHFLLSNKGHGFLVLGAVFLVVTGSEALYADMGHFGPLPIRITWIFLVFPALILNYFGQGALLLSQPHIDHPFYAMVPSWGMIPMVILASLATTIASQALITGVFSLTNQAIQLGFLPRMRVMHTSARHIGQIYVAPINWLLMVCTIGLVIGFKTSGNLASAYGVAIAPAMLLTTLLFSVVMRSLWKWHWLIVVLLTSVFFVVDLSFFCAGISKLLHGAWFPLVVGVFLFIVMHTWAQGREILTAELLLLTMPLSKFKEEFSTSPLHRVEGRAIFLSGNPNIVPLALIQNIRHNRVLHSNMAILHCHTENVPRVPNWKKISIEEIAPGFSKITARYGFMEKPRMESILALSQKKGVDFSVDNTSFFLGREKLTISDRPRMGRWSSNLFAYLSRNSLDAASFYGIESTHVIEVGVQLRL